MQTCLHAHALHTRQGPALDRRQVYWNEFTSVEVLKSFFEGRDAAYWRSLAPAAVDNYYCRLLLGEAAFHEPVGALGATHLAAARLMLLQYDLVLVLEAQVQVQGQRQGGGCCAQHTRTLMHTRVRAHTHAHSDTSPTGSMQVSKQNSSA